MTPERMLKLALIGFALLVCVAMVALAPKGHSLMEMQMRSHLAGKPQGGVNRLQPVW